MITNNDRRRTALLIAASALATASLPAMAANRIWDAGGGTLVWDTEANWSPATAQNPGRKPGPSDNAQFDDTGFTTYAPAAGYTIAVNSPQTINLLRFADGDGVTNLTKNLTLTGNTLNITVSAGGNAIAATAGNSGSHVIQNDIVLQPLTSVTGSTIAQFAVNGTGVVRIDGTVGAVTSNTQLNKSGAGYLVLNGNTTYTGATNVLGGALELNGVSGGSVVLVQSTLASNVPVLTGSGTISGDLTVSLGSKVTPGEDTRTLTVVGTANLLGTYAVDLDGQGHGAADILDVGALVIGDAAQLDLSALSTLDDEAYVFARYTTLEGEFLPSNISGLPTDRYIDYHYNGNQIAVVPEPATVALLTLPLFLLRRARSSRARK